jgi:hypothetical protein
MAPQPGTSRSCSALYPGEQTCPKFGATMNRPGEKLVYTRETHGAGEDPLRGGMMEEMHACPNCGTWRPLRAG